MAIDANAMYRAGFGSKSTGKNVRVDEQNARLDAITKTAFNVLGQAAIGQIKQNYKGLQEYRNASDSQTALLNLKVDKMPASSAEYAIEESQSLKGSVVELKSLYDAAARKASFGIGKKRSQGRQDMARYMKQLIDMNAVLEIHKTKREKAQSMTSVAAGGERQEGAKNMSAGSDVVKVGNSTDLALGGIGARLRWNIETGEMEVQVGGDWQEDENGLRTYKDKAETGTYEEYVAENQEMNLKLKQKQLASQPEKPEPVMGSRAQVDIAGNPIETPYEESETGKYAKESLSLTPNPPMSREDWTKQKQEERGAVSTILYKNMKFAVEADGKMAGTIRSIGSDILKMSYKKGAIPWERVSEKYYGELQAKIGEYTDDEFKDYFFGGDTFDHSTGRMTESAPAYQLLYEEDEKYGLVKDGKWKDSEKHGPGTEDWEGRLLLLKGQSFVKGSFYRKEATDRIFKNLKNKYTENVKAYKTDNEIPMWKQEGYANKGAYLEAQRSTETENNWLGVDLNQSVYTFNIEGEGATYVKQKDMKNTADTILDIEKKGAGFFEGYDGVTYTHKDGKWSVLSYNEDTQLQESKPYDRANMLTNLKFSDKPQMLEYLKKVDNKNKTKTAATNPITDYKKEGGKWYYIKGGQKKEVDASNFERLEVQTLIALARGEK
jgi:hypothetical protein